MSAELSTNMTWPASQTKCNGSIGNQGTMSTGLAISHQKLEATSIVAKPLRVAFSWTLAGNAVYYACQWGMLSVLAKLGSAAVVGRFALGMAITAPVFMFTNLQLRGVQATDSRSEFEFADYFTLRCLATSLGFGTVVAVALLSRYDRSTLCVVVLVAGAKLVESLSDVVAGLMQKVERLDQLAISLMIKGIASITAFTAIFWTLRSLAASVLAIGLTWLMVFLLYDFRLARKAIGAGAKMLKLNSQILGKLVVLSLPLGIVMALMSLNTNFQDMCSSTTWGKSKLGIFASLAYLGTAASLIINALGQSAAARLSRMFADRQFEAFTSLLRKFAMLGALIGVIGVPAGGFLGGSCFRRFIGLSTRTISTSFWCDCDYECSCGGFVSRLRGYRRAIFQNANGGQRRHHSNYRNAFVLAGSEIWIDGGSDRPVCRRGGAGCRFCRRHCARAKKCRTSVDA